MLSAVVRIVLQFSRRLVARVLMIASLALLALLVAVFAGPFVPDWIVDTLGTKSLNTILNILAASMLTVTTFSLSVLTGATRFASSSVTPRSRLILRDDTVTHSILASFVVVKNTMCGANGGP